MMLISPSALVDSVAHRVRSAAAQVLPVFWFQVTSDREAFGRELRRQGSPLTLVPLVIRGEGFGNPNSILSDLARLIEANRESVQSLDAVDAIVLLGAVPLQVAQLGSPVVLPYWFPKLGGQNVHVVIEDLTYTADVALNPVDVQVARLSEELWRLERVLVDRLESVQRKDHRRTNALLTLLRSAESGATISSIVDRSRAYRDRFREPSGFRPSARDKDCFVARLVLLAGSSSPDELAGRATALADALECSNVSRVPAESMPALLLRPTTRDPGPGARVARNLLTTVYASFQIINAVAHAGEYGRYPVLLLKTCSHDLVAGLATLGDLIESLTGCDEGPVEPMEEAT
jgi:hypothetical protein